MSQSLMGKYILNEEGIIMAGNPFADIYLSQNKFLQDVCSSALKYFNSLKVVQIWKIVFSWNTFLVL